jgi:hypothetical protein
MYPNDIQTLYNTVPSNTPVKLPSSRLFVCHSPRD